MHFFATDSPAPRGHHNDNCRNKDAPFPDRLRPWIHRHVLYSSTRFLSALTVVRVDIGGAHLEASKSVAFHSRRPSLHLPHKLRQARWRWSFTFPARSI